MHLIATQTVRVQTDWISFGIFIVSLTAVIGGALRFLLLRIDKYTDRLNGRFDSVQQHLANQDVKIARIEGLITTSKDHGNRRRA